MGCSVGAASGSGSGVVFDGSGFADITIQHDSGVVEVEGGVVEVVEDATGLRESFSFNFTSRAASRSAFEWKPEGTMG